jgi:DNA-binding PadR family transcriptional regulator
MAESPDLTNTMFFILLALADEPRHGLGIVDEVEDHTKGRVSLGPALLYSSLKRLSKLKLVRPSAGPPEGSDPRRKYYRITDTGRGALGEHGRLWETAVGVARAKKALG